jgi:SAM-dependent methyltransferase
MPAPTEWPPWTCPTHGVELLDQGDALVCQEDHAYPRMRGIPRFVPAANYAAAFGEQWLRYRLTQLDSHSGTTISEDRVRRCLGEELWATLADAEVLECGCGAGRFTEVLLARGARVTSVDLSAAVEANRENFPESEAHRVAQADIGALPFPEHGFDLVFCLGVVQHTPDPEATIQALYERVQPGGWLVFDHYSRKLAWRLGLAPLFRAVLKRLPAAKRMRATEWLVDLLLPLHRRAGRLGPLLTRVSPVYSYYTALPQLDDAAQREWALLDTHDALTDWYKHFRSEAQIQAVLSRLGLERIWCARGGNGVEARGRRPVSLRA